mgnify:CR=1 FL=1
MDQIDWKQHDDAISLKKEIDRILASDQIFQGMIWLHPKFTESKEGVVVKEVFNIPDGIDS